MAARVEEEDAVKSKERTNEDSEAVGGKETGRKPSPREWAKWAGYDCGE